MTSFCLYTHSTYHNKYVLFSNEGTAGCWKEGAKEGGEGGKMGRGWWEGKEEWAEQISAEGM